MRVLVWQKIIIFANKNIEKSYNDITKHTY